MNARIIGVSYVNRTKKDGTKSEGISLAYAFPCDGFVGGDVRKDWISVTSDAYNQFRPYINGKLADIINRNITIDLLPTGYLNKDGSAQMRIIGLTIQDK